MKKLRTLQEFLKERLADKEQAIGYLDVSLEEYQIDGDTLFFLRGLCNVIEAQGGVVAFADHLHIKTEVLLEVLASENAPHLDIFINIITALGGRLSIVPLEAMDLGTEAATEDSPVTPRDSVASSVAIATESG